MKFIVCGGRDYSDFGQMNRVLMRVCQLFDEPLHPLMLIHGNAPGADRMARDIFETWGKPNKAYPAKWKVYGKRAGPVRNLEMLVKEYPDFVVAFPGGSGTRDMIQQALLHNVPVKEITNNNEFICGCSKGNPCAWHG